MKHSVDIEQLRNLYIERKLTLRQISEEVGIPYKTIGRYLKDSGVQLRNPGDPIVEQLTDREWLVKRYVEKQKSTTEIAAELGCSSHSVGLYLKRHGIKARSNGSEMGHARNASDECRKKMSDAKRDMFIGPNNPNWRGGIQLRHPERGRYRYKMWTKAVKDRDGWRCTECNSVDRLHAHHIKPWVHFPDLRYEVSNGATLCHSCHEAAHGREFRWPKHAKKPKSAPAQNKRA